MIIAFTGSSRTELSAAERTYIRAALDSLPDADTWLTGGAHGVDTFVHCHLVRTRDGKHGVAVPAAPWSGIILPGAVRIEMPAKPTRSESYMVRNDYLALADHLVAFPRTPVEEKRSGTWATVRRARKGDRLVTVFPLSHA